jgi:glycosyltransferase involved in cell wall biosynthesis
MTNRSYATCQAAQSTFPPVAGKPLVSVIIIFFNASDFLEEAIESVFAQTYAEWELLLVDDGSTDASADIAKASALRHPSRVSYLTHDGRQNRGTSASRNLGIRHAHGEYIAFLDADDVWVQHKLEQQVALLQAHPLAGMVCGATLAWYGWTGDDKLTSYDEITIVGNGRLHLPANGLVLTPPTLLTLLIPLGDGCPASMSNIMLRRELIEEINGFEEQFRGWFDDHAFFAKVYLNAPVVVTDSLWDFYRQHSESYTARVRDGGATRCAYLRWCEAYLLAHNCQSEEVWSVVQNALWPYRNPIRAAAREWRRAPVRQARRLVTTALRRSLPAPLYDWLRLRLNREQLACGTASRLSPGGNAGGTVKSGGWHKLGR